MGGKMTEDNLPDECEQGGKPKSFEQLRLLNSHGAEYWNARDLQTLLGYRQWRSFEKAVTKAITSCEQSGNQPADHFVRARKMISIGKGGQRDVDDYSLSRFACGSHEWHETSFQCSAR
jgi:DNA-damage-inducible protein D